MESGCIHHLPGIDVWQYTWRTANQERSPELQHSEILLGLHDISMTDCPCGWFHSPGRLITHHQTTLTHTVDHPGMASLHPKSHFKDYPYDPKPPDKQRYSYQAQYSKKPDITSQKPKAKARPFLWARPNSLLLYIMWGEREKETAEENIFDSYIWWCLRTAPLLSSQVT